MRLDEEYNDLKKKIIKALKSVDIIVDYAECEYSTAPGFDIWMHVSMRKHREYMDCPKCNYPVQLNYDWQNTGDSDDTHYATCGNCKNVFIVYKDQVYE